MSEDWPEGWAEENANARDPGDHDPWEGYEPLGMLEEDPPEVIFERLNDYVSRLFVEVHREVDGTAVFRHLRRVHSLFGYPRTHTHCTCAVLGILDPSVIPVRVYSRDCGLLAHRLKADPPRQEP